jgi:hypothetical protein
MRFARSWICPWSGARPPDFSDLKRKARFTVWDPNHFIKELKELADGVAKVDAAHVIWGTVPHITIAPIARAWRTRSLPLAILPLLHAPVDQRSGLRCCRRSAHHRAGGTGDRFGDRPYNDAIVDVVRRARRAGRDWLLLDLAGVLDRLATRRYIEDPVRGPTGGRRMSFRRCWIASHPNRTRASCEPGPMGERKAGCSPSMACIPRRSATASSHRSSST